MLFLLVDHNMENYYFVYKSSCTHPIYLRYYKGFAQLLLAQLCKYELRKGYLFVLRWAIFRAANVWCMYMAYACFYVCCSDCMVVCGNVCCVAAVVKNSISSFGVLKYVECLCKGCDGCCVVCLYCEAWTRWCSCMGSMSVSSCRYCVFESCVHSVAVLNAAFCMACSWIYCAIVNYLIFLPLLVLSLLLDDYLYHIYFHSEMYVQWNSRRSSNFPIFHFSIFIDINSLFQQLQGSVSRCTFYVHSAMRMFLPFYSHLSAASDVQMCELDVMKYTIVFNPVKSTLICFNSVSSDKSLHLD